MKTIKHALAVLAASIGISTAQASVPAVNLGACLDTFEAAELLLLFRQDEVPAEVAIDVVLWDTYWDDYQRAELGAAVHTLYTNPIEAAWAISTGEFLALHTLSCINNIGTRYLEIPQDGKGKGDKRGS